VTLRAFHYDGIDELNNEILPARARELLAKYQELSESDLSLSDLEREITRQAFLLSTTDHFTTYPGLLDAVLHGLNMLMHCIDREQGDLYRIISNARFMEIPDDLFHQRYGDFWVSVE